MTPQKNTKSKNVDIQIMNINMSDIKLSFSKVFSVIWWFMPSLNLYLMFVIRSDYGNIDRPWLQHIGGITRARFMLWIWWEIVNFFFGLMQFLSLDGLDSRILAVKMTSWILNYRFTMYEFQNQKFRIDRQDKKKTNYQSNKFVD